MASSIACKLIPADEVLQLVQTNCFTKCAAVVRVYVADDGNVWSLKDSGIATIEKDQKAKTYYLRVYDQSTSVKFFEQEIFLQMNYEAIRPNFHIFYADSFSVGLAFADSEEAATFHSLFTYVLKSWSRKLEEQSAPSSEHIVLSNTNMVNIVPQSTHSTSPPQKNKFFNRLRKSKKNVTPLVSQPFGFLHVQHLGFDKISHQVDSSGIDDSMLQEFFKMGNLSGMLRSEDDKQFAINFIEKNLGANKFNQVMNLGSVEPDSQTTAFNRGQRKPSFQPPLPVNFPAHPKNAPPPPPLPAPGRAPKMTAPQPPSEAPSFAAPPPPPPPPPPAPAPVPAPRSQSYGNKEPTAVKVAPVDLRSQIQSFNKDMLKKADEQPTKKATVQDGNDEHTNQLAASLSQALSNLLSSRREYLSDSSSDVDSDF